MDKVDETYCARSILFVNDAVDGCNSNIALETKRLLSIYDPDSTASKRR